MTNISAIKTKENDEEAILFVTDSMGSDFMNATKQDLIHKLYKTGDFLVAGTGSANLIADMGTRLQENKHHSVDQVADDILKISNAYYNLKPTDILNFIVGGKGKEGLQLHHVNTTGNTIEWNNEAKYENRGYTGPQSYIFDGSAKQFVLQYIDGLIDSGRSIRLDDHVEGFSLLYDLSKAGSRHIGVNDKLQIGVIAKNKVSTLYHPDVLLNPNTKSWLEYVKEFSGENTEIHNYDDSEAVFNKKFEKNVKINPLFEEFYHAVETDMNAYSRSKRFFTHETERFKNGIVSMDHVKKMSDLTNKRKENVARAYHALVSDKVNCKIDYINDFQTRQKSKYTSIPSRKKS